MPVGNGLVHRYQQYVGVTPTQTVQPVMFLLDTMHPPPLSRRVSIPDKGNGALGKPKLTWLTVTWLNERQWGETNVVGTAHGPRADGERYLQPLTKPTSKSVLLSKAQCRVEIKSSWNFTAVPISTSATR